VLGFAHRGGMAHRPENTTEAFATARAMGAPGVETDAWLTADGQVVLHHDATLGRWPGRRIAEMRRAELPPRVPTLDELYRVCGTDLEVAVDILAPGAAPAVVRVAIVAGASAPAHLWLCGTDIDQVAGWRDLHPDVHLVHSDRDWNRHRRDPRGWCRRLAAGGVEALNLHRRHCRVDVVEACHMHAVKLLAWDVQRTAAMRRLIGMGVDGLMSDHVDRLVAVLAGR
jgi:glycerophosphoryl diester phosphodiesterase